MIGALLAVGYFVGGAGPDKTMVIVPADAFRSEVPGTSQADSQAAGRPHTGGQPHSGWPPAP